MDFLEKGDTKNEKAKKKQSLEYKKAIISEYLAGESTAQEIADREGLDKQQIYSWKIQ